MDLVQQHQIEDNAILTLRMYAQGMYSWDMALEKLKQCLTEIDQATECMVKQE